MYEVAGYLIVNDDDKIRWKEVLTYYKDLTLTAKEKLGIVLNIQENN